MAEGMSGFKVSWHTFLPKLTFFSGSQTLYTDGKQFENVKQIKQCLLKVTILKTCISSSVPEFLYLKHLY